MAMMTMMMVFMMAMRLLPWIEQPVNHMNSTIQTDDIRHNNWVMVHKDLCVD
jgi:hypothetical protein